MVLSMQIMNAPCAVRLPCVPPSEPKGSTLLPPKGAGHIEFHGRGDLGQRADEICPHAHSSIARLKSRDATRRFNKVIAKDKFEAASTKTS